MLYVIGFCNEHIIYYGIWTLKFRCTRRIRRKRWIRPSVDYSWNWTKHGGAVKGGVKKNTKNTYGPILGLFVNGDLGHYRILC